MASVLVRTHDLVGAVLMLVYGSFAILAALCLAVGALLTPVPLDWLYFFGMMGLGLLLLWVGRELLKSYRMRTK